MNKPVTFLRHCLALACCALVIALASTSVAQEVQRVAPAPPQGELEYQLGSVLWTQSSGEWRALCYQAFTAARQALDQDLAKGRRGRVKRAVVVDVDETVLDNSPFQARLVEKDIPFKPADWTAWVERAAAEPIPGALDFLRYATRRGVDVFYITNRKETERKGTTENLIRAGFPDVSAATLLMRTDAASKEGRRQQLALSHRIVLLCGDNLSDFSAIFEKPTPEARNAAVDANDELFGTRFIVLPNAMYGDWERAIYHDLGGASQAARRRETLRPAEIGR
jgi:5'-nucleotidase (lipoprotein e(P4) family)